MIGQFVRRYFCACNFVGSLVCRTQRCRAFPIQIARPMHAGHLPEHHELLGEGGHSSYWTAPELYKELERLIEPGFQH